MARTLAVVINREGVHHIEPETGGFEAGDDFSIELRNEGQATHVHLHLDDDLAEVASLGGNTNLFVEAGKERIVPVSIDADERPVTGRLKVVTGYGAETTYIEVTVIPKEEPRETVAVDEELSVKQPREEPATPIVSATTVGVVLLAVLAVAVAAGALFLTDDPLVMGAVGIVVLAVLVGLGFTVRST